MPDHLYNAATFWQLLQDVAGAGLAKRCFLGGDALQVCKRFQQELSELLQLVCSMGVLLPLLEPDALFVTMSMA